MCMLLVTETWMLPAISLSQRQALLRSFWWLSRSKQRSGNWLSLQLKYCSPTKRNGDLRSSPPCNGRWIGTKFLLRWQLHKIYCWVRAGIPPGRWFQDLPRWVREGKGLPGGCASSALPNIGRIRLSESWLMAQRSRQTRGGR